MNRLLTKTEVCEILAISRPTLDRIVADGDLEALRIRGQIRFAEQELLRYLGSCRRPKEAKPERPDPIPKEKEPARRGRPKGSGKKAVEQYYPGMRVV